MGRKFSALQAVKEIASGGDATSNFCLQVDQRVHPDVSLILPEGDKDIGIDEIREILHTAYDGPKYSPRKFYIIDGADRLTMAAANAFLKTLEEPPKLTQFFLIAESAEKVLPTIRSRCGKVRYKRLSENIIAESLKDLVPDPLMARVYTRLAEGSLGRAIQYFGSNRLALRDRAFSLLKTGLSKDLSQVFSAIDDFKEDLFLGLRFLDRLLYDLIMLPHDPSRIANLDLGDELRLVGDKLGLTRVRSLQRGVDLIHRRDPSMKILHFHVKSILGAAFVE